MIAQLEGGRTLAEGRLHLPVVGDLADPWMLVLLVLVPAALWLGRERRAGVRARAPLPAHAPRRTLRQRLGWLPLTCELAALVLTVLALARPLEGQRKLDSESEGIDLVLLLDRSSSMEEPLGSGERRFDVARRVVGEFAQRRMTDEEGAQDNVALLGFARFTELLCPFTLDADTLLDVLSQVDVEYLNPLDGTGIGMALAESVRVLETSEAESRVVVLLTDGVQNAGSIEPLDGARLAYEAGVRVYTVFAGPKVDSRYDPIRGRRIEVPLDVGPLPQIAELTEGLFFHAEDEEQLAAAYERIESLERTERSEEVFVDHYDRYPAFVAAALGVFLLAFVSRLTWARRVP